VAASGFRSRLRLARDGRELIDRGPGEHLAQDGGLWLTSTSPVLQSSYETFNASLTNAVNGISNFAQQFTSIAGQIKSMDTQMATSLSSGK
jgi:hypothetical protein